MDGSYNYNETLIDIAKHSEGEERRAALELLCRKNKGLIDSAVRNFKNFNTPPEDLEQEGALALIRCVDNYDPEKGSFSTYATSYIRGYILRYLSSHEEQSLTVPQYMRDQVLAYRKICSQYETQYNRRPMDGELSFLLDCPLSDIENIRRTSENLKVCSLSGTVGEDETGDDSMELMDAIADPRDRIAELEDDIQAEQLSEALWSLASQELSDKESRVLRRCFVDGRSLEEIGSELGGITRQAAHIIKNRALKKMRQSKRVQDLSSEYMDGLKHTSLSAFLSSWTSATERTAIQITEEKKAPGLPRAAYLHNSR